MREVRWQTMSTLAIKLLLAPIFIVFAYAIQKKYGPKIGGIFVAIPFIAAPILLVIYFEHGSEFLHRAITGTYAGQAGVLFYIYLYPLGSKPLLAYMFCRGNDELPDSGPDLLCSNL
jgi:hypothetical protein